MEKLLPILSESLYEILKTVKNKYNDPIASEICKVHALVDSYNSHLYLMSVDNDLKEVFNLVPDTIEELVTPSVRMISARIGSNDFEVSFLPEGKEPEYSGPGVWSRKNRQSGKPARIFHKLLRREFKTYDWEQFSNRLKSEICCCTDFELVSGEDIRKWYCSENYYKCEGSLGNSCMRYPDCSNYFDIYVDNAKMLISRKDGLLTGRAIVWELPDGRVLMDRIYTCFDYLTNCFIDYAKDHNWWIRTDNSLLHTGDDQCWLTPKDDYVNETDEEIRIHLSKRYTWFPYVDSFRYYDGNLTISTNSTFGNYTLDDTEGNANAIYTCECSHCGNIYICDSEDDIPEELVWSDYSDMYLCKDCRWYCPWLNDYVCINEHAVEMWIDVDAFENVPLSWLIRHQIEDSVESTVVKINGIWYSTSHRYIKWDEELQQYILDDKSED